MSEVKFVSKITLHKYILFSYFFLKVFLRFFLSKKFWADWPTVVRDRVKAN